MAHQFWALMVSGIGGGERSGMEDMMGDGGPLALRGCC